MGKQLAVMIQQVVEVLEPCYRDAPSAYECNDTVGLNEQRFELISKLAVEIHTSAVAARLEQHLPKPPASGTWATALKLPGVERGGFYATGLTGPVWKERFFELFPSAVWLGQLREVAKLAEAKPSQAVGSVTDNEYTILRGIRDVMPRRKFVTDLAESTAIDRKTVGKLLKQLSERGLVEYDSNGRTGAAITSAGLELLTKEQPTAP